MAGRGRRDFRRGAFISGIGPNREWRMLGALCGAAMLRGVDVCACMRSWECVLRLKVADGREGAWMGGIERSVWVE